MPRIAAMKEFDDITPSALDEIFDFIRDHNRRDSLDGFGHIFDNEGKYFIASPFRGTLDYYEGIDEECFTSVYRKQLKMFRWN